MAQKKSRSRSKSNGFKKFSRPLLWALLIIGLIIAAVGLFMVLPQSMGTVASVNGEKISQEELDRSYDLMVPPQFQGIVTSYQFLNESIIPQKLLLQAAVKSNIVLSDKQVDEVVNALLEANGLTQKDLETELKGQGLTIADFKETYRTRLTIASYLNETIFSDIKITDKEIKDSYASGPFAQFNLSIKEATPYIQSQLLETKQEKALNEHIALLRSQSSIEIYLTESSPRLTFTHSDEQVCMEDGKPLIRIFTLSTCEECAVVVDGLFSELANSKDGLSSHIYELDTGDDLMTEEVETAIPSSEVAYFKSISPNNLAPAYSFGCAYTRIGHKSQPPLDIDGEMAEFSSVIGALLNNG